MVARANKARLRHLLQDLFAEAGGSIFTRRVNLHLEPQVLERFLEKLPWPPSVFGEQRVVDVKEVDGLKLVLDDGSWVLFRVSGTEPIVRLYAEAKDGLQLNGLVAAGKDFIYS
jgi:phosphoglucomutase